MKTRQAVLVEAKKFEIQDVEISPSPNDIVVKMEGCGLCPWELGHWGGLIGEPPMPLGHEGFGTVVEVGKQTSGRVKIGDRVTGLGHKCFADYFTIPDNHVMLLRKDLDQANVPGEPLYCVQNVLRAAHPEIGDNVVVVGCGPMGQWVTQGLASRSLHALIAVDIDDRKLELARGFGATHTVNPKTEDAVERVKEITDGRLADVAVEGTGGPLGVQTAIDLLKSRRPKLVIMSSFKKKGEVDYVQLCAKAVTMVYAHPGITVDLDDSVRRTETLINNGVYKTDALISHRFPVEEIMTAFQSLESRPDGYLKGIVVP